MIDETTYADLDHALRGPLTVIVGETELVLSHADVSTQERRRSAESVIEAVRQIERLLVGCRPEAGNRQPGPEPI